MWPVIYNSLLPILWVAAHVLAWKDPKMKGSLQGKKHLWKRLDEALKQREYSKPLIWFHVPSAGEFLLAQPLLERFLQEGFECAVTVNSPSGYKWIAKSRIHADKQPVVVDYLPLDFPFSIRRWIHCVKPSVLVLVKYDLWPNLIWQSKKAGIPIYMVSGALQPKTRRYTSRIARSLYGNLYSCFTGIFAITLEDKQRFLKTRPDLSRVEVIGNTGFDSVIARRDRHPIPDLPEYLGKKRVCVVGSSWPTDESCIFPALRQALEKYPDFSIIIVPHEPTEEHLRNSEVYFKDFQLIRLSQLVPDAKKEYDIILVDSVGILSSIYHVGHFAFVGAGFTTGVHNVTEPCAIGLPVSFGPRYYNSAEALQLVKDGIAFPIENEEDFRQVLFRLLDDPSYCTSIGNKCREFVESRCGASEKCFRIICEAIDTNWKADI